MRGGVYSMTSWTIVLFSKRFNYPSSIIAGIWPPKALSALGIGELKPDTEAINPGLLSL